MPGDGEKPKREPRIEVISWEYAEYLRTLTPEQKLKMVNDAFRTARVLAEAGARDLHPDWTDEQIKEEVKRRMFGGSA